MSTVSSAHTTMTESPTMGSILAEQGPERSKARYKQTCEDLMNFMNHENDVPKDDGGRVQWRRAVIALTCCGAMQCYELRNLRVEGMHDNGVWVRYEHSNTKVVSKEKHLPCPLKSEWSPGDNVHRVREYFTLRKVTVPRRWWFGPQAF